MSHTDEPTTMVILDRSWTMENAHTIVDAIRKHGTVHDVGTVMGSVMVHVASTDLDALKQLNGVDVVIEE